MLTSLPWVWQNRYASGSPSICRWANCQRAIKVRSIEGVTYCSCPSSVRAGSQYDSPVSLSFFLENHLGLWAGNSPLSRFCLVARWWSSRSVLSSFARSYAPRSNACWSGRRRQSVGGNHGLRSSLMSLRVIANGVLWHNHARSGS